MATELRIGDLIPLAIRLPDRDTSKFVRARLFNALNIELAGSPVNLPHLSSGAYADSSLGYPNTPFVNAIYDVYEDAFFTTLSESYLPNIETFTLDTSEEAISSLVVNLMPDITAKLVTDQPLQACLEADEPLEAKLEAETVLTANLIPADEAAAVSIPSIVEASERTLKSHRSAQAGTIAAFKAWAFNGMGDVVLADANVISLSDFAGINTGPIDFGMFGDFAKQGNLPGAAIGLGATPGDYVYLSGTPGELTLSPSSGSGDVIFIVGRAEPGDGVTGAATDLYIEPQEQG